MIGSVSHCLLGKHCFENLIDILQCVTGMWTSLIWLWWFGHSIEPIFDSSPDQVRRSKVLRPTNFRRGGGSEGRILFWMLRPTKKLGTKFRVRLAPN